MTISPQHENFTTHFSNDLRFSLFVCSTKVKLLLGLSEEDLSIPPKAFLEAQETKPYPDLHDESAIEVFFFQSVIQLMTICGIHDFGLRDLIAPNAKRLKRQLSGAINFCKFYEERTNMYGELTAQRNELLDGLGEVEAENELLQQQKQESQIVAMDRSKEIEEVENECLEVGVFIPFLFILLVTLPQVVIIITIILPQYIYICRLKKRYPNRINYKLLFVPKQEI